MAITTGNLSRVSSSLQTFTMLQQLQQNTLRMFREQQRLSSGERLLSAGEDPIAAERITRLRQVLSGQDQVLENIRQADGQLGAADSALTDLSDLLNQAATIASEQAGSLQSAEERASQAVVIRSIIDQLRNIGNRQYQGQYLFGGRDVRNAPLTAAYGAVTHVGDAGERQTLVSENATLPFNVSASVIFGLGDALSGGSTSFDAQLSAGARVRDLAGAANAGVRLGRVQVTTSGPAGSFEVDFTGAETIADLIARFDNAATLAGSPLTLGISPANGATLRVSGGVSGITISDVGNGTTAADLGLRKTVAAGTLDGDSVHRRVTLTTPLSLLQPGGVALPDGIRISNGGRSATVSFAGATTVQDVLNQINTSGVGVRAFIAADGGAIQIENQIAGSALVIGENGGTDALKLGIRTLDASVPLSRLNGYRGIHPISGPDFRVTDSAGLTFDVDVNSATTIGDVITLINTAAGAAGSTILASVSSSGGGISLTDPSPTGAASIRVDSLNLSPVAGELGLAGAGTPAQLDGGDVGGFYQPGVFSALYRLVAGLEGDDSSEITEAGTQLNALQRALASTQGQVGARSQTMRSRLGQTEDAVTATRLLLSDVKDVDFTEAVTRFQQAQTALQAGLQTSSRIAGLSLLDYL